MSTGTSLGADARRRRGRAVVLAWHERDVDPGLRRQQVGEGRVLAGGRRRDFDREIRHQFADAASPRHPAARPARWRQGRGAGHDLSFRTGDTIVAIAR